MPESESNRLHTLDEVAAFLRVAPRTVYKMIAAGELHSVRIKTGEKTRYVRRVREAELQRYLKANERAGMG